MTSRTHSSSGDLYRPTFGRVPTLTVPWPCTASPFGEAGRRGETAQNRVGPAAGDAPRACTDRRERHLQLPNMPGGAPRPCQVIAEVWRDRCLGCACARCRATGSVGDLDPYSQGLSGHEASPRPDRGAQSFATEKQRARLVDSSGSPVGVNYFKQLY